MAMQELRESCFNESKILTKEGKFIVAGSFSKVNVRNGNGRVYKTPLWQKLLSRPDIKAAIAERRMLGELGHPDRIETTPTNVSHIVTKLELQPDGNIYGEAEILDTPSGKILKTLYEAGVKMGISSRGFLPEGSNLYPEGKDLVVPDDFELVTFDFVIDPSSPGANPTVKESVKTNLAAILTEGREKVNSEISNFIDGLNVLNEDTNTKRGMKLLSEAKPSQGAPQAKTEEKEDLLNMAENKVYAQKLEAIISDLTERYLTAESIIKDLLDERLAAEDILKDVSKRYITSEAVIKELRSYALKLESTLADVVSVQKVSEEVIADLRERYTLSEQVIAELRDRYTLSEEVIASLRDRNSLSEGVIAELCDKVGEGKQAEASEMTEGVINNLKNRLQVSEDVIAELTNQVKEAQASKEQAAPARIPVPANYFEEIASKYRISVQEAKETFKKLDCKKKAFEFHLEERKKLISNHYGEYPYMIDKAPGINVYESKDMSAEAKEKERIARIVAHTN